MIDDSLFTDYFKKGNSLRKLHKYEDAIVSYKLIYGHKILLNGNTVFLNNTISLT